MNDEPAITCRINGWDVGTLLIGDEGYGPTVIEITALGIRQILARAVFGTGAVSSESMWTLSARDWSSITLDEAQARFLPAEQEQP